MRIARVLLLAFLAFALAACSEPTPTPSPTPMPPMPTATATPMPTPTASDGLHPAVIWQYDTGVEPYAPVVSGRMLYASAGHYVHAIDTVTGEQLWQYGESPATHSPLTEHDGIVYVGSSLKGSTFLVAIDSADGSVQWRVPTDGTVSFQPVVSGWTVVAAGYSAPITAFDVETGNVIWQSTYGFPLVWDTPIVDGGTVYALEGAAAVVALDAATGRERWLSGTTGTPTTITLADGTLYAVGEVLGSEGDVLVEAIDPSSGEGLWEFTKHGLEPDVVVAGGTMYAKGNDRYPISLTALDPQTGFAVWWYPRAHLSSPPVVSDGVVYAGSSDGIVFAFDAASGDTLDDYGPVCYAPVRRLVVDAHVMYAACGDGRLYAIGL